MRDLMVSSQIWGGVIGGLGLEEGNSAADFYASYYNDHVRGTFTLMRSRGSRVKLPFRMVIWYACSRQ